MEEFLAFKPQVNEWSGGDSPRVPAGEGARAPERA